jgi:hypothetical protein
MPPMLFRMYKENPMRRMTGRNRDASDRMDISDLYWTVMKSNVSILRCLWVSSKRFSKASILPMEK